MRATEVALGDVASIVRKTIDPRKIATPTSYVGLDNIVSQGGFTGVASVVAGDLASAKFVFTERDILFGKLRPYLAKIGRPQFAGICSTDILPIRPGPEVDRDYLAHYLSWPRTVEFASRRATGANLPRLSPKELERFRLPLPPLGEQRRIARVLDTAASLRTKRLRSISLVGSLLEATFNTAFGDTTANTRGWPMVRLEQVARTTSGGTPSRNDQANFGGSIPWVKSGELHAPVVTETEESITELGIASSSAKIMPKGTLLVAMYGATVGAISTLGIEAATNQAVCSIQVGSRLDREFLAAALRAMTPSLLARRAGGAQPNLSQTLIRQLELPLPSIDAQQRFAEKVVAARTLTTRGRTYLNHLDILLASLQSRAFAGEL